MLLVDKIVKMDPGKSAEGIKCVTMNEWFFPGHFPDEPIMPGVLIVEALAQAAGVLALSSLKDGEDSNQESAVYFVSIDNVRFRKPVKPGDTLRLCVEVLSGKGRIWKFQGKAYVGDTLTSEAEFKAMVGKKI
jgi:3-hydroxyacyl-[acyl-carrier-protein] dehydratase